MLTIVLCLAAITNAYALPGTVRFDEESPYFNHRQTIADIYIQSCAKGLDDSFYHTTFPIYVVDKITENFKKTNSKTFPLYNQTISIVAAGYNLGRALSQTDTDLEEQKVLCFVYGSHFTATVVNFAENKTNENSLLPAQQYQSALSSLKFNNTKEQMDILVKRPYPDNPLYDLIINAQNANIKRPRVTPRLAESNGCRYMYVTLAMQPVIEVNAMDATLDIMVNMIWDGFSNKEIAFGFNYFLSGAKFGRFLFATKQPITMCYD